jgi:hypothetical protein
MDKIPMGGRGSSKVPRSILEFILNNYSVEHVVKPKSFTPPHKKNRRGKFKRAGR